MQLAGMQRISQVDADYIVVRCNEIEARIMEMDEKSPYTNNEEKALW